MFYAEDFYILLVGMIISAIIAGSLATLVSILHIFITYASIQLISMIAALIYLDQEVFYLSALLASSFLYLVILNGQKQHNLLKEMLRLNEQVSDLLNNAGEGFLSFDKNMKCERGFSLECQDIFKIQNIEGLDISTLLFSENNADKELFTEGINRILTCDDTQTKDIFLSLLPKEQHINNLSVKIQYKILYNNRFMIILTDITQTKKLEEKINYQNKIHNMIIAVASNRNDFIEIKTSFENFINNEIQILYKTDLKLLKRELHTFKGIFVQKEMIYIVKAIHELENNINNATNKEDVLHLINEASLQEVFYNDVALIYTTLGEDFLNTSTYINVDTNTINVIESKIKSINEEITNDINYKVKDILHEFKKLKYESFKSMIKPYIQHVKQTAINNDKLIYELEITGDNELKVGAQFKPFVKSLVHIFNNCIDHGIEDQDTRFERGKDLVGTIKCNFVEMADILVLKISDDGGGIDIDKLSQNAIANSLITDNELKYMSDEEKCNLIFIDTLSTKEIATTTSGMGVGMNAVKDNLDKIGGKLSVSNTIGHGVSYIFTIPLKSEYIKEENTLGDCQNICDSISNQSKIFLKDTLNIQAESEIILNDLSIDDNYAQIDLMDGFEGSVIIVFSDELRQTMNHTLIPDVLSDNDKEIYKDDLPKEAINTVVGLSMKSFPKHLGDINISPPIQTKSVQLNAIIQNSKDKFIKQINTKHGKLICIVIEKEK